MEELTFEFHMLGCILINNFIINKANNGQHIQNSMLNI